MSSTTLKLLQEQSWLEIIGQSLVRSSLQCPPLIATTCGTSFVSRSPLCLIPLSVFAYLPPSVKNTVATIVPFPSGAIARKSLFPSMALLRPKLCNSGAPLSTSTLKALVAGTQNLTLSQLAGTVITSVTHGLSHLIRLLIGTSCGNAFQKGVGCLQHYLKCYIQTFRPNNRRHGDKVSATLQLCPCCGR